MEGTIVANINTTPIDDDYYDNDRISDLPDFIAHHILSFLVDLPKELIRTGVLSKYVKDKISNYVGYTTSRFSQQQNVVSVNTFKLFAVLRDPAHASIIDRNSGQKLSMISDGCFSKLCAVSLSNLPFLETLILKLSRNYINFKLSSHSLRKLSLETQSDLDEIEIDTPNLLYFQYSARKSYVIPPIIDLGESKTCMVCFPNFDVDTSWFQKLRRFLDRTIQFEVLKLHILKFIDVEELKLLESHPIVLEHIELSVCGVCKLSEYLPAVDAVLWCCRPRSLILKSYFCDDLEKQDQIVKFTSEKLLEQEYQGQTNIQIVFSTVKAFVSNYSLTTFLKEEVNQEAEQ